MASKRPLEKASWKSKTTTSSDIHVNISGVLFNVNKELLAAKSSRLALLFRKHHLQDDLSRLLLVDAPAADPETFELVARFCHGFQINLSTENVVQVCCLAFYLGMTEEQSACNLLQQALLFFERRILPSWSKSIQALVASEKILKQALQIGLVDACAESIITQALNNSHLLGEPIKKLDCLNDESKDEENMLYRPNAKRKLFIVDWKSEDLTILSLQLYEPIIKTMIQRQVPWQYVASSLSQYAKRWVFSYASELEKVPICKKNIQKEVVEAVERLLPGERGVLPCTVLFQMLRSAIALEASSLCRNGIEIRIGNQLDQATVKDLLIPSQGYSKELQYDTECVRRILKNFYINYTSPGGPALIRVAELLEEFLAEVACDIDLKLSTFISLADMAIAASVETQRSSDGIYKAVDTYLDKHKYLTESEREELCRVLDCNRMSPEAQAHAAQNERLPLRLVVQVLFVQQLQLRETVSKEGLNFLEDWSGKVETENDGEDEAAVRRIGSEEVRLEMEKMGSKVMELERECHTMKREIQKGGCSKPKKEKVSVWKRMKRKIGCISNMADSNCHVKKKKVHPR